MCIDYRKLNEAIRKDHFPLHFMDQMLEQLVGQSLYYFLDECSRYNQISVDPKDQEKMTFNALLVSLPTKGCHLGYVMHQPLSRGAC